MANQKISDLAAKTTPVAADTTIIVDSAAPTLNKKVTLGALLSATPTLEASTTVASVGAINNLAITTKWIRFTGAGVVLSGLSSSGIAAGTEVTLYNANTSGTNQVQVLGASGLSSVGNRFANAFTIGLRQGVKVKYNATSLEWEVAVPSIAWEHQGTRLPNGSYHLGTVAGANTTINGVVDGNLWAYLTLNTRQYFSDSNLLAVDMSASVRKLYDFTGAFHTIDWGNCDMADTSGVNSVNWSARTLVNGSLTQMLDWAGVDLAVGTNIQMTSYGVYANSFIGNSLVNPFGQPLIDTNAFTYFDGSFVAAINMGNRQLLDVTGSTVSVDWLNRALYSSGAVQTASWDLCTLTTTSAGSSIDWNVRQAYVNAGTTSIDWENRYLYSTAFSGTIVSVDYGNHILNNAGGFGSINFNTHLMFDGSGLGIISIDYTNRLQNDAAGTLSIGYDARILYDQNAMISVNYNARELIEAGGIVTLNWNSMETLDSSSVRSISWGSRGLYSSGNALMLDWSATGTFVVNAPVATFKLGTAAVPSITFAGDTNTGIYSPSADNVAITCGGAIRFNVFSGAVESVGQVRAGAGTAALPSFCPSNDTNSGMFGSAADTLGFSAGGTERVTISGGSLSSTVPLRGTGTTAAAPAFASPSDTNTGMFLPGSDIIGFSTNSTERVRIDASGDITLSDGTDFIINTTTGTKIGTATTQKLSLWNATPIVQPTTGIAAATFVANTSGIANNTATFDGYTIGQIVKALRNIGALA